MEFEPAQRFITGQSWWIASEIARRHPHLQIIETHPGGGMSDCLTLIGPGPETLVQLNRPGSITARTLRLTWTETFSATGGHDLVRKLEADLDLKCEAAPPTTARTLTYRVLARVLTSLVDDRHSWTACNGWHDNPEEGGGQRGELRHFPTVAQGLRDQRPDDLLGIPAYRYWLLLEDDRPVAVLDTDGRLHQTDKAALDLLALHRRNGSRLTSTVGTALGHLLP